MLVVFVAQLVGGVLAFVYREQLPGVVTNGLTSTLSNYGGFSTSDMAITKSWDFVQTTVSHHLSQYYVTWSSSLPYHSVPPLWSHDL